MKMFTGSQVSLFESDSAQLTCSPPDSHVNPIANPAKSWVLTMSETCGQRFYALLPKSSRVGLLVKTLLDSSFVVGQRAKLIWQGRATRQSPLTLRLRLSGYQQWNGISGFLPRPMAVDWKGTSRQRHRGAKEHRHNFRESIRESPNDDLYPNPAFAAWVKGFPENLISLLCEP